MIVQIVTHLHWNLGNANQLSWLPCHNIYIYLYIHIQYLYKNMCTSIYVYHYQERVIQICGTCPYNCTSIPQDYIHYSVTIFVLKMTAITFVTFTWIPIIDDDCWYVTGILHVYFSYVHGYNRRKTGWTYIYYSVLFSYSAFCRFTDGHS